MIWVFGGQTLSPNSFTLAIREFSYFIRGVPLSAFTRFKQPKIKTTPPTNGCWPLLIGIGIMLLVYRRYSH